MTGEQHLLEMRAAHAARVSYNRAAERHAERALEEQDHGHRERARYLARLALRCQKASSSEYEGARR